MRTASNWQFDSDLMHDLSGCPFKRDATNELLEVVVIISQEQLYKNFVSSEDTSGNEE